MTKLHIKYLKTPVLPNQFYRIGKLAAVSQRPTNLKF
nr:MAG TPA: hypothetical protein [Caudoviricetes sp.]